MSVRITETSKKSTQLTPAQTQALLTDRRVRRDAIVVSSAR